MGIQIDVGENQYVSNAISRFGMKISTINAKVIYDDSKCVAIMSKQQSRFLQANSSPIQSKVVVKSGLSGCLDTNLLSTTFGESSLSTITDLKLPTGISSIDPDVFYSLSNLTALTFPYTTSVETISAGTFQECQNLKVLALGNGISSIEENAFRECSSLEKLELPYSLSVLGTGAFLSCPPSLSLNLRTPYSFMTKCDDQQTQADEQMVSSSSPLESILAIVSAQAENSTVLDPVTGIPETIGSPYVVEASYLTVKTKNGYKRILVSLIVFFHHEQDKWGCRALQLCKIPCNDSSDPYKGSIGYVYSYGTGCSFASTFNVKDSNNQPKYDSEGYPIVPMKGTAVDKENQYVQGLIEAAESKARENALENDMQFSF